MRFDEFVEINPKVNIDKGEEYPFVEMEAVVPTRRYVQAKKSREFGGGGSKFRVGDTLFARITPCLENGKIAQFVDEENQLGFGSTEFIVFRAKPGISDPSFVYYLAKTKTIRGPAEKSMSGASGRQRADAEVIRKIEVDVPSLDVQQKIASILSAYDDLIENNLRRIKILEEMAQTFYREWFVKFRFPGHQKVKMVDSPLGKIPEGWEVKKVTDAIAVNPTTKVPREGEKPFVSMGSLSNDSMLINGFELRSGNSGSKFSNGDTLFARITPCLENGKTAYVQFLPSDSDVAFGSTEFIVLRSKTLCPELVYFMARSNEFRGNAIKSMSGASGRQRVQEACFDKFLFAHPDPNIVSMFAEQIAPIFRYVHTLSRKNDNLRQTRDLLLPNLISGELDVSELDITIPEANA
jgi:type I restriction enzyme S subunit